jgi:hypothetical protein
MSKPRITLEYSKDPDTCPEWALVRAFIVGTKYFSDGKNACEAARGALYNMRKGKRCQ